MGEGGSRRLTDEESFFFIVNTSSTAIARTPKTHFIRFREPRSGPPSPTGEGYSILPLILHALEWDLFYFKITGRFFTRLSALIGVGSDSVQRASARLDSSNCRPNFLPSAGFEIIGIYGNFKGESVAPCDEKWYFVARCIK